MREIIRIGLPAGLQGVVVTLSNVFVQYFINGFDVVAIAAFTAYYRIELLFYMPLVALGQAMMTFTGQNVGARLYDRVKSGLRTTLIFGVGYSLVLAAILLYFGRETFGVFYSDPAVIDMGVTIIWVSFPFYFFYVFLEVFADTLRGGGLSDVPMYIVLFNQCLLRTLILFGFMQLAHDTAGGRVPHNLGNGRRHAVLVLPERHMDEAAPGVTELHLPGVSCRPVFGMQER